MVYGLGFREQLDHQVHDPPPLPTPRIHGEKRHFRLAKLVGEQHDLQNVAAEAPGVGISPAERRAPVPRHLV